MTIERTRQILGSKIAHLSDEEVLKFISSTDKLLDVLMKKAVTELTLENTRKDSI